MPEEIQNNPSPQVQPEAIQPEGQSSVAPGIDSELDAALNNSFKNFEQPVKEPPKAEVKASNKPENKPEIKAEKIDEKLPEPEAIQDAPPGKSSQSKDGWNALRSNYKKAHRLFQEKEEELRKVKASLAEKGTLTQKETEALKAQIEDLSKYRAMIDIQSDPQFVSTYDQPIDKAIDSIKQTLRDINIGDDIIEQIDFTNTKIMDEIIGHVGEHRDKFVARKLQRKVEDLVDLKDKRDETLNEQKSKYKEYVESKKKESFSKSAEEEGRMIKHLENIGASKDKAGHPMFPFLNKMQAPENASQPEVENINNHNRLVDLMGQKINSVLKMNSPEEKVEAAVAAVATYYLSAQLKAANSKINSLQEELKKISTVGDESERTKTPSSRRSSNGQFSNSDIPDVDSALSDHFARTR